MKKVLIDARMYGLEHAGIGRYIMSLLMEVKKLPKTNNTAFHLIVSNSRLKEIRNDLGDFYKYIPSKTKHYSILEQIELPLLIKKADPDIVHFPHFNVPLFCPKPYVVTIHDLIKHYFKGKKTTTKHPFLYWPKYFGYRLLSYLIIKKSKAIIVPTNWWKEKLAKDFRVSNSKIFVTWEGVGEAFLKRIEGKNKKTVLDKFRLEKNRYFVYTGNVYPHKNVSRLIEAVLKMKNKKVSLAIVCSRNVFSKKLENIVKQKKGSSRIKFLGFVPDSDLKIIYKNSLGLVQPSLMEGFGLTGLEAMACDCPVLSSNASCLPEVYGNAAHYFDPKKVDHIMSSLEKITNSSTLRKHLIEKGRERFAKFSWKQTAFQTVDVYRQVINEKKS